VRELDRLLGRKTMEVEILKEALELARAKSPTLLSLSRRWAIPGEDRQSRRRWVYARSNIIERRDGGRPQPRPQERAVDVELASAIHRLVDARPTYGYRRIAALLKRERRSEGHTAVNAKRVSGWMKKHGLLLQRRTGRRRPREHDGQVVTIRSNCRWCSDVTFPRKSGHRVMRLLPLPAVG
jgi:transposase InsO family protein